MRGSTSAASILVVLSTTALAARAQAQPTPPPASDAGAVSEPPVASTDTSDATASPPSLVLTRAELLRSGLIGLGELLQRLPQQGNAVNAQLNNGGDGPTRIALRSLGASRTLVLLDGRAVAPGGLGADDAVDLNSIPRAMIERVELHPGGHSVRYGSGAIGGVVDLIPRRDLDGTEVALSSGVSSHGDGARYDASVVTGISSSRGRTMFAVGYQHQQAVLAGDRDFSAFDRDYAYNARISSRVLSNATPEGRINARSIDAERIGRPSGAFDLCGRDGAVPIQFCTPDGAGGFRPYLAPIDQFNPRSETYLVTPSRRLQAVALADRQLRPRVRAFFEAWASSARSEQRLAPDPLNVPTISGLNLYNPIGLDIYAVNRRLVEAGPRRSEEASDALRLVLGVDGELPAPLAGWRWELAYVFGGTRTTAQQRGFTDRARLALAVGPSFLDSTGAARCGSALAPIDGCVPINLLAGASAGEVTRDMLDYLGFTGTSSGANRQHVGRAEAHGPLAELPSGGQVALAAGADVRHDAGTFTPDSRAATNETSSAASASIDGSTNAAEAYATVTAVPLVNRGALERLALEAGARVSNYDSFGTGLSWRLGAQGQTAPGLSLHASYSVAFRAPSIAEGFAAGGESFLSERDPCGRIEPDTPDLIVDRTGQCERQGVPATRVFDTASQPVQSGGNRGLEPERAAVLTLGLDVAPPALPCLRLGLGYSRIALTDQIGAAGGRNLLVRCYERGEQDACARIHRDPNEGYIISAIDDRSSNDGAITSSSLDVAASYEHAAGEHRFAHRLDAVYQISHLVDDGVFEREAVGVYDFGVFPAFKANLSTRWAHRDLSAAAALRWISGYDECSGNRCRALDEELIDELRQDETRHVTAAATIDLSASYQRRSRAGVTALTIGVDNALDQTPPAVYNGLHANSDALTYDYLGSFVYARVEQQF